MFVWYFSGVSPAPEVAFAIDGRLEKVGLRFVDCWIVEWRWRHLVFFIHSVGDFRPRKVADAGALVAVFGVSGIETDLKAEGLILGLFFEELNAPVTKDLGFVTLASIWLFLEIGPAANLLADVPHRSRRLAGNGDMFFAQMTGSIACLFQDSKVGRLAQLRVERTGSDSVEMLALVAAGEEAGSSDPAGGGRDKGIFEADPFSGEAIDVWGFNDWVPGTT